MARTTKSTPPKETCTTDGGTISVLLADDHKILRSGLRGLIEKQPQIKVVAEAEEGRTAVQLCRELSPNVVIMDISMPDLNGIEATRQILSDSPGTKVIILSIHKSHNFVKEVFKAGAHGYLVKNCSFEDVVSAICAVNAGETYLHPKVASIVRKDYLQYMTEKDSSAAPVLSPREREVLQLLTEGKNTKEIAYTINLSVKTVETHRQRIMEKLNIHSIAELTKYAIREGLTSEEI
jgi:DNA-binding NarL/FixJ family response regulator